MSATVSQIFRNVSVCIYICVCVRKEMLTFGNCGLIVYGIFCTVLQLLYKSEIIYNKKLIIIKKNKSMVFCYINFQKEAIDPFL